MKKQEMKKPAYVAPLLEIVRMDTVPMLNGVSGTGIASDIEYGGEGNEDDYGD